MYCLTVSYPKAADSHFDYDYYREKHIPLCNELFRDHGLRGTVLRTNEGKGPGSADLNYASIDILFESAEQLGAALQSGGQSVGADVPNYTNVQPIMTFGDIELSVD
jgi:uncharacterized protein (TIGR02118 family)